MVGVLRQQVLSARVHTHTNTHTHTHAHTRPVSPNPHKISQHCQGLHYREADVPAAAPPLPPPPHPDLLQSTSFHTLERAVQPWGPHLSYGFLSPIFDSISKPGYTAAGFDAAAVRVAASGEVPLFALGGVTAGRIGEAEQLGFAGVAVLGGVWGQADPPAAVESLLQACEHSAPLE